MTLVEGHRPGPSRVPYGLAGPFYGAYPALVTDVADPDGQGRVRVSLPWSRDAEGSSFETWARLATLMAGSGRGTWFIPDVADEVLVVFEGGDPRRPYVVGALWNGQDDPPEDMDGDGRNNLKVIHTRSGVKVTLDDSPGTEGVRLDTPGGQSVILQDGPGTITIEDANGNSATLESSGITVSSASTVTVSASRVEISAGMVSVDAGMSNFSGVVRADTVITNSVVSTSYTPGAGNIW